ncbi:MAG: ParB/RepB/Spo0J family partition protein [Phycisphaerales bacterium]
MNAKKLMQLAVASCVPDPTQPRKTFDPKSLARMAETIRINGDVEQPIHVVELGDGRCMILFGERRWRAASIAGVTTISAIVEQGPVDPAKLLLRRTLENTTPETMPPLELAAAIEEAISLNDMSASEVAAAIGLSESYVSKLRLIYAKLPPAQKELLAKGKLSVADAYELARLGDGGEPRKAGAGMSEETLARKVRSAARAGKRKRQKVTLTVRPGCTLAAQGPEVTLPGLTDWLTQMAAKARLAVESGSTLPAFLSSLRKAKPAC